MKRAPSRWDKPRPKAATRVRAAPGPRHVERTDDVIAFLRAHGPATAQAVARQVQAPIAVVSAIISGLAATGVVERIGTAVRLAGDSREPAPVRPMTRPAQTEASVRIARATGLPEREVRHLLRDGRTEVEILAVCS